MFTFFAMREAGTVKLAEKKRKDILEAAIREFREQGFPAARVNRIAELAEVSKRTLYKHFESKEVLFQAITDILLEQIAATPRLSYDPNVPLQEQLKGAVRNYVGHLTGEGYMGLNRLVMSELLRDQDLAQAFFAKAAIQDGPIQALIGEAMQAGALRQAEPGFARRAAPFDGEAFLGLAAVPDGGESRGRSGCRHRRLRGNVPRTLRRERPWMRRIEAVKQGASWSDVTPPCEGHCVGRQFASGKAASRRRTSCRKSV